MSRADEAIALHQLGQHQAALRVLDAAHAEAPTDAELWYLRGRLLDDQGRPGLACGAYRRAIELDPDHRLAWDNLAFLEGRLDPDAGIARHQQLLHRFGDDATIRHNLACLLRDQGRLDEAFAAFQRALALDASKAPMWVNLGNLHLLNHNPLEARDAFEHALHLDPTLREAQTALDALL
jgi:Flp pilus assembly protein TadD